MLQIKIADNIELVIRMHVVFKTFAHFNIHVICNKRMALQNILYSDLCKQKCQARNLLLVKPVGTDNKAYIPPSMLLELLLPS